MNRTLRRGVLVLLTLLAPAAALAQGGVDSATSADGLYAVFETTQGDIVCQLYYDKAPITVANFVGLATGEKEFKDTKTGEMAKRPFYDGLKFHRIIANFMIQGGCPLGTGTGDPGYKFMDEFDESLKHDKAGVLSMANSGPATNGSQFFITHKATPWLDNKHTVFGQTVHGQDVVDKMAEVEMTGPQNSTPVTDIVLTKLSIVRTGKDAKNWSWEEGWAKQEEILAKQEEERKKAEKAGMAQLATLYGFSWDKLQDGPDGLRYAILKDGSGASPLEGQTAVTHYTGHLLDGSDFDSSRKKGRPYPVKMGPGGVIQGWLKTLPEMKVGEHRIVVIPPELGYGERGYPGFIPGNATLLFEMELIEIQ